MIYHVSIKLIKRYYKNIVLYVAKLWYSLIEDKNHWFATYLDQYRKKPKIKIWFYDICLFITRNNNKNFGIAELKTNNIVNIRIKAFMKKKKTEIIKTKFKAKTWKMLKTGILKNFDNYYITIKIEFLIIIHKN